MANINYSEIMYTLEKASLFDIYRLSLAMQVMLEHPEKLEAIKKQLRVGMLISYFRPCIRLVEMIILDISADQFVMDNF